jgi:ligand-binding SRPBCC domain-containing protein
MIIWQTISGTGDYLQRAAIWAYRYLADGKHVRDREFFIDEQRAGPYSIWHHQHHFREIPGGVEMIDLVHYRIPGWVLGDLANRLFIRQQLKDIFTFRKQMVEEIFGIYTV